LIQGLPAPPSKQRKEVRITIPLDKYPDYNFKGVLIGARGMNQKRLEKETGCMIAVRGKGMRKRRDGKEPYNVNGVPEDELPTHVLIAAYDQESLEKGIKKVNELLVPVSQEERRKQMKELAIMNGTYVVTICHFCGEEGHKVYRCPKRYKSIQANATWQPANVQCAVCGDSTHPTYDCPHKAKKPGTFGQNLNQQYEDFMAEITGEKSTSSSSSSSSSSLSSSSPPSSSLSLPLSSSSSSSPTATSLTLHSGNEIQGGMEKGKGTKFGAMVVPGGGGSGPPNNHLGQVPVRWGGPRPPFGGFRPRPVWLGRPQGMMSSMNTLNQRGPVAAVPRQAFRPGSMSAYSTTNFGPRGISNINPGFMRPGMRVGGLQGVGRPGGMGTMGTGQVWTGGLGGRIGPGGPGGPNTRAMNSTPPWLKQSNNSSGNIQLSLGSRAPMVSGGNRNAYTPYNSGDGGGMNVPGMQLRPVQANRGGIQKNFYPNNPQQFPSQQRPSYYPNTNQMQNLNRSSFQQN